MPSPLAGRRILLLIVALTLLPVAIGGGLYYFGWRPAKTSNHGTLIEPPVAVRLTGVTGKWSLLLVDDARCGEHCAERMDGLRRVRVALAKEWQRTQQLRVDKAPDGLDGAAGTVLIVDPNGMAMMRYAPDAPLEGIRADLERLLKYSWIG